MVHLFIKYWYMQCSTLNHNTRSPWSMCSNVAQGIHFVVLWAIIVLTIFYKIKQYIIFQQYIIFLQFCYIMFYRVYIFSQIIFTATLPTIGSVHSTRRSVCYRTYYCSMNKLGIRLKRLLSQTTKSPGPSSGKPWETFFTSWAAWSLKWVVSYNDFILYNILDRCNQMCRSIQSYVWYNQT